MKCLRFKWVPFNLYRHRTTYKVMLGRHFDEGLLMNNEVFLFLSAETYKIQNSEETNYLKILTKDGIKDVWHYDLENYSVEIN